MHTKKVIAAVAVTAATVVALFAAGTPANAATGKNGNLEVGEFGLYYLQNQGLPVFDLYVSDNNFADDKFFNTNISTDNNTESYYNRDTFYWWVYTGAGYTGSYGCIPPNGYKGNASSTFKDTISSAQYFSYSC